MLELITEPVIEFTRSDARYGYGLFETARIEEWRVPLLSYHLKRLAAGAVYLGIAPPPPPEAVEAFCAAMSNFPRRGALRLYAFDGRLAIVPARGLPDAPAAAAAALARSLTRLSSSPLCRFKTLSRLENELLAREAAERGLFEVVALNEAGRLSDGARTTVFVVRGGRVLTPPLADGALPGIARQLLLEAGIAEEAPLRPADIAACEAAFLANALRLVVPLATWEGQVLARAHPAVLAATALLASRLGTDSV